MRKLLFISLLFSPTLLFAQQAWEPGAFSCVAGENGENVWQGTAGQPLDGTASGGSLLYGNTEIASSLSEAEEIRGIRLNKKNALAGDRAKRTIIRNIRCGSERQPNPRMAFLGQEYSERR